MANTNYDSPYTGQQIDSAVGKALSPDSFPTDGSSNLVTSGGVADAIAEKAPLASPAFEGSPTAATQSTGNNSTRLATTAFVKNVMAAAPSYMTMDDAPTAGSNNPVKSKGLKTALDGKQATLTFDAEPKEGSQNPVKSDGIYKAIEKKAPIASPALTGTPSAPTPTAEDNSTRIATTRFVHGLFDPLVSDIVDNYNAAKAYGKGDYVRYQQNGRIYKILHSYPRYVYQTSDNKVYRASDSKVMTMPQYDVWHSDNYQLATLANDISANAKKLPNPPSADGTYRLTVTVSGGVPTYSWT